MTPPAPLSSIAGRSRQLAVLREHPAGLSPHAWQAATPGGCSDDRAFNANREQLERLGEVRTERRGRMIVCVARGRA